MTMYKFLLAAACFVSVPSISHAQTETTQEQALENDAAFAVPRILTAALVAGALTGCTPAQNARPNQEQNVEHASPEARTPANNPIITYRPSTGPTVADGLEGTIEYDSNCSYLRSGDKRFLVFWPEASTRLSGDGIIIYGDRRLPPGARVHLTGTAQFDVPRERWPADRRPGCDYTNTIAIAGGLTRVGN